MWVRQQQQPQSLVGRVMDFDETEKRGPQRMIKPSVRQSVSQAVRRTAVFLDCLIETHPSDLKFDATLSFHFVQSTTDI